MVTEQISQRELRNDSGRIIRALVDGETFIITSDGRPVGELRPLPRDRFVERESALAVFRNSASIDWHAMRDELDDVVDADDSTCA